MIGTNQIIDGTTEEHQKKEKTKTKTQKRESSTIIEKNAKAFLDRKSFLHLRKLMTCWFDLAGTVQLKYCLTRSKLSLHSTAIFTRTRPELVST